MSKKLRPLLSLVLLLAFLGVGVFYIARHRSLLTQLSKTPLSISAVVFLLYALMVGVLVLILSASVRICRTPISPSENTLLNSHSLFINFFIPGQGGPAYRGLYLYKRHKLRVKDYIIVTLLYYAIYAVINVFLLLVLNRPWWQTVLGVAVAGLISWLVVSRYTRRAGLEAKALDFSPINLAYLIGAALMQAILQIIIYHVELHSVNSHIKLTQVITYTGAANLALFVSLTPGAIGIRESFLIFTRHLHHISSANIIVANVIDRSVYIVFLLVLLLLTVGLHVKKKEGLIFKLF
jgi:uncharacterized membrane protein YbhN (UPF0104 family)